ncbi:TetR/AcrR family transcriptional regulator [Fodinicola acaciae]|uniref:TetR/AcrR family transcriptional regulator n=1 Tax=Fodinicola acaciae TaxID=2681555 RepID=UPI0013D4C160|nr:TetR family transcriptional regulator [Fodinicola acaciae]
MDRTAARRERRKVARRALIRAAAVRLALEKGPDSVTVEEISEASDIAPRTFFNYFASKDDVYSIEPFQWTEDEILAELRARPAKEAPLESMRAVVKAMAVAANFANLHEETQLLQQLYERHPELFARMRLGDQIDAAMLAMANELATRIGTDPETDQYPHLVVGAAFAAMQTAEQRSRTSEKDIEALIDDAFDLLARGL